MNIKQYGMYFAENLLKLVSSAGGSFTDIKERPVVTMIKVYGYDGIYWTVPMGDLSHRTREQLVRIKRYMDLPKWDIRSCFYHIGNTDKKSLFFISDVLPITKDYIGKEYLVGDTHYVIKNRYLLNEIERKIGRILSFERTKLATTGDPYFRQNIFGVLNNVADKREQ